MIHNGKRIIRVFPQRNSYTPDDEYALIGLPGLIIPEHDEVHVSCTFTWDKEYCEELAYQWEGRTDKPVKLGGPHLDRKQRILFPECISRAILYSRQEGATITAHGVVYQSSKEDLKNCQ